MSAAAFLALLFRLAKGGNRKKNEEQRMSWAAVGSALLQQCLPDSFELAICTSRSWDSKVGFVAQSAWARILVRSGVVQLSSTIGGPGQIALLIALAGNKEAPSITEFAWALDAKRSQWLLTQLVLELGGQIDQFLKSHVTPSGILELRRSADLSKSAERKFRKLACKWLHHSQEDLKGLLCKCYFSGRRYFAAYQSLSMAVDATRIGG